MTNFEQKSGAHPLMIIGVFILVLPFLNFLVPFNVPKWIFSIGLIIMAIGAVLTVIRR